MVSIFEPTTIDELRQIVAGAVAEKCPIEVSGGSTKKGFGRPSETDAVLRLGGFSGISYHEPGELVLTAGAATPVQEIESRLRAEGQMLAFEPTYLAPLYGTPAESATIGGTLACNLSGPRRPKSGAARDHFLGVKAVSGRGELFKSGGRVVKNVTGYDMCKLLCGSFGTLAVMTDVTLKVVPAPMTTRTVLVFGLGDDDAVKTMGEMLGGPHDVSGAAHFPMSLASGFVPTASDSVTALRIEGEEAAVLARAERLEGTIAIKGDTALLGDAESIDLWRAVRDLAPFVKTRDEIIWRLAVLPGTGARIVGRIARTLTFRVFYDWAGGLIWLAFAPVPDAGAKAIRAVVEEVGGTAMLVRAEDRVRTRVDIFEPLGDALRGLSQRLKESFDPMRILNPGRMYAGL